MAAPVSAFRAGNLALRFVLELVTLAVLAVWGAGLTDGIASVVTAVAAPAVAALAWGTFVAPKARVDAGPVVRVAVEIGVLASGVAALWASGCPALAAVLAVVDLSHLVVYHLTDPTATSRGRRA